MSKSVINNKKVLFLSGGENDFYDQQRNAYSIIRAKRIFKRNSLFQRLARRIVLKFAQNAICIFFGDWRREINNYDLIILPVSIYSRSILNWIEINTRIPVVSWYWNPVHTAVSPSKIRTPRSAIFSFDRNDCAKYNLQYISTYYFKSIILPSRGIVRDLVFVGADKGRLANLLHYRKIFGEMQLNALFHITCSDIRNTDLQYAYKPVIKYEDILVYISESLGILDFVQEGQVGLSQRPMEALFFRKKLVTNDVSIMSNDFYKKENIFILGLDDISALPDFLISPYCSVPDEIIDRYDFESWVQQLLERILPPQPLY